MPRWAVLQDRGNLAEAPDTIAPSAGALGAAIVAGCVVAFVGFGFAAAFGVLLKPMSDDLGWGREIFSLSIAIQGLFWGVSQPFAGMVADRYGTARVLAFGAVVSATGFWLRGAVIDPDVFVASGVVIGIGTGACSFPVVIIALGKIVAPERRSFIMGLGTAAASLGLFVGAPLLQGLLVLGGLAERHPDDRRKLPVDAAWSGLHRPCLASDCGGGDSGGFGHAIRTAFGERSFVLLFFGFFVCGFHVAFMQTHLPAYIEDVGLDPAVGGWSLALIGLFNIAGSFGSGWAGQRLSKRKTLAMIYLGRAAVITVFLLTPVSTGSVLVFSGVIGLLWLSTVPLTTGLVAQTQGLRFLSTLVGVIFLGHQAGMFAGAWLGGFIFDRFQDYSPVWWAAVALGLMATLLHLPIDERPGRLARAEAA